MDQHPFMASSKRDTFIFGESIQDVFDSVPSSLSLDLFSSRIQAGFPSPGDDYVEKGLDLNEHLIHHPSATFFVRVAGDSMVGVGIHDNDILVVDRSLEARDGSIIIAVLNGELTVKRLRYKGTRVFLFPENPLYPEILIQEEMTFLVWGVVTAAIHQFPR